MTATWILVLLFVAFVAARIFRSTKMWTILIAALVAGLLVGMLSKEAVNSSKENKTASTQLINTIVNGTLTLDCTQSVAYVTDAIGYSRIVGYNPNYIAPLPYVLVGYHIFNGRDSPGIEDDS